jgi:hypothetical protein
METNSVLARVEVGLAILKLAHNLVVHSCLTPRGMRARQGRLGYEAARKPRPVHRVKDKRALVHITVGLAVPVLLHRRLLTRPRSIVCFASSSWHACISTSYRLWQRIRFPLKPRVRCQRYLDPPSRRRPASLYGRRLEPRRWLRWPHLISASPPPSPVSQVLPNPPQRPSSDTHLPPTLDDSAPHLLHAQSTNTARTAPRRCERSCTRRDGSRRWWGYGCQGGGRRGRRRRCRGGR